MLLLNQCLYNMYNSLFTEYTISLQEMYQAKRTDTDLKKILNKQLLFEFLFQFSLPEFLLSHTFQGKHFILCRQQKISRAITILSIQGTKLLIEQYERNRRTCLKQSRSKGSLQYKTWLFLPVFQSRQKTQQAFASRLIYPLHNSPNWYLNANETNEQHQGPHNKIRSRSEI